MPRQVTIVTPENVRIEYELAGAASRGGAAIVDLLAQALLMGVVVLVAYAFRVLSTAWMRALIAVGSFLVLWGYYVLFETIWNGQTPGKRLTRLRTVRDGGLPVDLSCAAVRNLVRIVDFLPLLYVFGAISVLVTRKNQRLGDLAAGTLVVKERAEWMAALASTPATPVRRHPEADLVRNIELVTSEEFEAVSRFVDRMPELQQHAKERIALRIARPLMLKLGIEDDSSINYSNLLAEIHSRCVNERGMK